ncbi:MAG: hypothetical protein LBJ65_13795 [Burkholderia sp.]|uniref:hypothetical protein n=1 Tax=Burkholderia sp. TaxID=36773 RepID=UPI0028317432|nr:hypothetical protein [Burkholderia sp.]MDR0242669.1 hypothetical protein [Burkholderia sp.]
MSRQTPLRVSVLTFAISVHRQIHGTLRRVWKSGEYGLPTGRNPPQKTCQPIGWNTGKARWKMRTPAVVLHGGPDSGGQSGIVSRCDLAQWRIFLVDPRRETAHATTSRRNGSAASNRYASDSELNVGTWRQIMGGGACAGRRRQLSERVSGAVPRRTGGPIHAVHDRA